MARRELNISQMRMMRFISLLAIAMSALVGSSALAADKTTAVWNDGRTSAISDEELIRRTVASPGPPYPKEAREAKMTGSGLYELRINKAGAVTEVVIVKSSRSAVLDSAAKTTFRKWRFKPGIFTMVRIPVSWSVNPVRD
jgi:TonB family protein